MELFLIVEALLLNSSSPQSCSWHMGKTTLFRDQWVIISLWSNCLARATVTLHEKEERRTRLEAQVVVEYQHDFLDFFFIPDV